MVAGVLGMDRTILSVPQPIAKALIGAPAQMLTTIGFVGDAAMAGFNSSYT